MATYAISDIHGALGEFQALLKKINFRYDGSDTLYLLGDYGDWGSRSMETILFVMELQERYPFVHCLMGNHEMMFFKAIEADYMLDEKEAGVRIEDWLTHNRGRGTWTAYRSLPRRRQDAVTAWLASLPYSAAARAGGRTYLMAHAYPYHYDMACGEDEARRRQHDALWRRLMLRENPFASYEGTARYDLFVCGHTITDYYFQKLRYEKRWPRRKPGEHKRNRIFRAERFIDIDCGAKCMDCGGDSQDVLQTAAMRAQLAALRLDDGREFYVHRPALKLPEGVALPQVRTPDWKLPEIRLPDVREQSRQLAQAVGEKSGADLRAAQEMVQETLADISERFSGAVNGLFPGEKKEQEDKGGGPS